MENSIQLVNKLNELLDSKTPVQILDYMFNMFEGKVGFSTSLGLEDQVITHMLHSINKSAYIFTLDTGRLFSETYDLLDLTTKKYDLHINVFFPEAKQVQEMVSSKGINLFYDSVENRQLCCSIRKMEPLKQAFNGLDAWVCGLRRGQSPTRKDMKAIEWDSKNGLIKVNPLIDWSETDVWDYIHENNVPYNRLHDKGYPSIGCQPCTRAIMEGEDIRAGRWWWENPENRECGLHKK
ncbi:MAG: phosphoadenylyl-sulfate reductase [Omnitrophica WOR_2 bacterium]